MAIPTSLYIHIPWCIKKCPYCDFNSHKKTSDVDEAKYISRLIDDFATDLKSYPRTQLYSIFVGGGTPSLFSPSAYDELFSQLRKMIDISKDIEITLEANPGAVDSGRFREYRALGINRLSIGVQSFDNRFLKTLGRVHDANMARNAIEMAQDAGFSRINIDLMYGLPGQSVTDALSDIKLAIDCQTEHLSWYELTIEPNTVFYKKPPVQPHEAVFDDIEKQGRALLAREGFERYEISAYSKAGRQSQHNLNYWLFGDYFGIGAGAHAKLTTQLGQMSRLAKIRQPNSYIDAKNGFIAEHKIISSSDDRLFEFMLNASRLLTPISFKLFTERTGLPSLMLMSGLQKAASLGLVNIEEEQWQITAKGQRFNNELIKQFLLD